MFTTNDPSKPNIITEKHHILDEWVTYFDVKDKLMGDDDAPNPTLTLMNEGSNHNLDETFQIELYFKNFDNPIILFQPNNLEIGKTEIRIKDYFTKWSINAT